MGLGKTWPRACVETIYNYRSAASRDSYSRIQQARSYCLLYSEREPEKLTASHTLSLSHPIALPRASFTGIFLFSWMWFEVYEGKRLREYRHKIAFSNFSVLYGEWEVGNQTSSHGRKGRFPFSPSHPWTLSKASNESITRLVFFPSSDPHARLQLEMLACNSIKKTS